jgi:RNA polymerase sigma-70 factor (ECF subfamily)
MRRTGDYALASDILQESFTRYLERYGENKRSVSLLYTIGRNLVFDAFRKKARSHQSSHDPDPAGQDDEHRLLVRDEYRRVLDAMQQLKEDERDILSMIVSSELSYREIADIIGISEANVKVKVHRARLKLRRLIQ